MENLGPTVGGWFASAVISSMVDKARSHFGSNYDLHADTDGLLNDLAAALPQVEDVIEKAEQRLVRSTAFAVWLQQLRDAASEAEDVLDDFEAKKITESTSAALAAVKTCIFSDADLRRLKGAVGKLGKICSGNLIGKLELTPSAHVAKSHRRTETCSRPLDTPLVGRDEEKNLILDMILFSPPMSREELPESSSRGAKRVKVSRSDRGVEVIPITGAGGVGKTTLAQMVYNDQSVQDQFELRGWIWLSENYDARTITQDILLSFSDSESLLIIRQMNLDRAQSTLRSVLQNRIFLLVLDDVCAKIDSVWPTLMSILSAGAPGSVVLATTQWNRVAQMIGTTSSVMLDVLPWDSFWPLFQHHAFSGFLGMRDHLELIGMAIAEKLQGLPLAARAVGNLLRLEPDEEQWEMYLKSDWWSLDTGSTGILPSLGLVYQHLDAKLKQCFAFCSIFPKNYLFEKDRLVQMWIAHGFIIPGDECVSLEVAGRRWFDKLLDQSFFQRAATTWRDGYIMPGLMRDLATAVSANECRVVTDATEGVPPRSVRHLSVDSDHLNVRLDGCNRTGLRTILFFGGHRTEDPDRALGAILNPSPSLRVLDLSYTNMKTVPPIALWPHLRFLDLSHTSIHVLPRSFSDGLCHLQVLDLRGCKFTHPPTDICKLINLRHLYAEDEVLCSICMVGKLTNLQELQLFRVRKKEGHRIPELQDLSKIGGRLSIRNLEEVACKDQAVGAKLAEKRLLRSLVLSWELEPRSSRAHEEGMEILDGLQPHVNLEELTIKGYTAPSFPPWVGRGHGLTQMRCIELTNCKKLNILPPLGQLPKLQVLRLQNLPSILQIGDEFYGGSQEAFRSLEELSFKNLSSWEEWSDTPNSFKRLGRLRIEDCSKLGKVPPCALTSSLAELVVSSCDHFNGTTPRCLGALRNLTRLTVHHCPGALSLPCGSLASLEALDVWFCAELRFSGGLRQLVRLKDLQISHCPRVASEAMGEAHLVGEEFSKSLVNLAVRGEFFDDNACAMLGRLPSLQTFDLADCKIQEFTAEQNAWLEQLPSLRALRFRFCDMTRVPSSLATLSTLKKLLLEKCRFVHSLPDDHLPRGLQELLITGCLPLSNFYELKGPGVWPDILSVRVVDPFETR